MVSVTDVRVGRHDGFDRVVFDIGGEGLAGIFPAAFFAGDQARALVLRALAGHLEMCHQTHRLQEELSP